MSQAKMTRRTFGQIFTALLVCLGLRSPWRGFTCPNCGRPAHVVCSNRDCTCWRYIRRGEQPLRWTADGEGEQCPYCGFTAHADFWLDREMDLIRDNEAASLAKVSRQLNS